MVVLPLLLFSVLMEWIEILFLARHPSSLYYCIPIFSPTTIGWKLHFILSFWWLFFSLYSFIFPRDRHYYFNLWLQLSLFLPRCSLLLILAMAIIFLFFASAILLSSFYYIVHCCLHGLKQPLLLPRHMIVLISLAANHGATRYYLHIHILSSFTLHVTATIYIILSTLWALGNGSLMTIIYWIYM